MIISHLDDPLLFVAISKAFKINNFSIGVVETTKHFGFGSPLMHLMEVFGDFVIIKGDIASSFIGDINIESATSGSCECEDVFRFDMIGFNSNGFYFFQCVDITFFERCLDGHCKVTVATIFCIKDLEKVTFSAN